MPVKTSRLESKVLQSINDNKNKNNSSNKRKKTQEKNAKSTKKDSNNKNIATTLKQTVKNDKSNISSTSGSISKTSSSPNPSKLNINVQQQAVTPEVKKFKPSDLAVLGFTPVVNKRNSKGETQLHAACVKVSIFLFYYVLIILIQY